MKFNKILELEEVEQWKDRYVDYYFLKQCIMHNVNIQGVTLGEELVELEPVKERRLSSGERKALEKFESFEEELAKEVGKVEQFFRSRHHKFITRLQELTHDIGLMKGGNVTFSPSAVSALRKAYHDNHVQWKLLRKYQETNKFGFVKILKRYDFKFRETQFDYFVDTYLQNKLFWDSHTIETIVAETKQVYTKYFAASDERLARSQLRKSDARRERSSSFFAAVFFGIAVVMSIVNIYDYSVHFPKIPPAYADIGWFIYRISLIPILLGTLYSLNAYIWEKYNINYVFVFKFDPTHYRSPLMYLQYGLCALSVWLLSFYFFLDAVISTDIQVFYDLLQPLLFVIIVSVFFFLPLPILGYRTRFFLIRELSRVIRAGLPGKLNVSFADFIMAIHLIALSEFFLEFQVMFCIFQLRDNTLCHGNAFALPILNALPHWCRMFQCIRRWRQTGQAYPHLASAFRPASSLVTLVLAVSARTHPEYPVFITVWLVCNSVFSVIRWYSDLLIDFGFVKFGLDFSLRKARLYPTWIYYFVMVNNFCLRYVWLVVYFLRTRTKVDLTHPMTVVFLSTFELIWCFQFVFFRMENEHFNCSDRYNIIQDIPLPFTKKYEALAKKNALKSAKREARKQESFSCHWRSKLEAIWFRFPITNSRKKLHKSIARAIHEVEHEHPSAKQPTAYHFWDHKTAPSISSTPHVTWGMETVASSANGNIRLSSDGSTPNNQSIQNSQTLLMTPSQQITHSPHHSPTPTPALSRNHSYIQTPEHTHNPSPSDSRESSNSPKLSE